MLIAKLTSFIKETLVGVFKAATSKEGLKSLYGVSLYRNAVYLVINSAVLALTGFLFWVVAARLYPASDVGLASAAIAAVGLVVLLSNFGLQFGLGGFISSSKRKGEIINSCLTIAGLGAIAFSLIFLAGLDIWAPHLLFLREDPVIFAGVIVFAIALSSKGILDFCFIGERRAGFTLAKNIVFGVGRLPLLAILALGFHFHSMGIFGSWGITLIAALGVGLFLFAPKVQKGYRPFPVIKKKVVNELLHFSLANYVARFFEAAPSVILPLMVLTLLGPESNAYFYIGFTVASALGTIPFAASLSLFAEGSYDEVEIREHARRSLKFILVLLIPAIILMLLLGEKILLIFGGAYSQSATRLLWILAVSALPHSIAHVYFGVRRAQKKMKGVIGLFILQAIMILSLSYLLLPQFGILGVGIAVLISSGVLALIAGYPLWKLYTRTAQK